MKITIFWFAWSWKSTVWKILSELLGYEFMSSWNIMRSWADELWLTIYEFEDKIVKNDYSFDIKLDKKVEEYWINNDNFIFESRLARNFISDSFKIYLKCDESERYNRIQKREWTLLPDIIEKNHIRERWVEKRYSEIYPNIQFPPNDELFDLVIDVNVIKPEEIVDIIMKKILVRYMNY